MIVLVPILLLVIFLLAYEGYALATGHKLVTMYVRDAMRAYPSMLFLVGFAMGLLSGHLFWYQ